MQRLLLGLVSAMVLAGAAWAGEQPSLYKGYRYGMPKAEVARLSGAVPCEDIDMAGHLCVPGDVDFGSLSWEQVFLMDAEARLVSVLLAKEPEEGDFDKVARIMDQNGFLNLYIVADDAQVDLLAYLSQNKREELAARVMEVFADSPESFDFCYVEGEALKKVAKKDRRNFLLMMANAPLDMRAVDVMQEDGILAVKFCLPLREAADEKRRMADISEKF